MFKNWLNSSISFIVFFLILNTYGKIEHKMLHNAPSLDLSSIILIWKKSRKIDHITWIDTELIWNLIFSKNSCLPWKKTHFGFFQPYRTVLIKNKTTKQHYSFLILNTYGKMEHKMLHNAPSLDLSSIIGFEKNQEKLIM